MQLQVIALRLIPPLVPVMNARHYDVRAFFGNLPYNLRGDVIIKEKGKHQDSLQVCVSLVVAILIFSERTGM